MPSVAAGNMVLDGWTVLDQVGAPLTGMLVPADVTLTLLRQSGSTMIAASEVIAWQEIGVTGRYYFSFTPTATGLYLLILNEIDPLSAGRTGIEFRWDVVSAGSILTPSFANAFCSEADVERRINAPITSTTSPSDTETAAYCQGRAGILMSLCAGLGNPVTPSTVTAGSRLESLLRTANEVGGALDYLMAQTRSSTPFKVGEDRLAFLRDMWDEFVGGHPGGVTTEIVGIIAKEIGMNLVSLSTNHTLSGDTIARDNSNPPQDVGAQVTMGDVY
jgi:hypothetical protein